VPRLVVVDLRVALDEAGKKALFGQIVRRELEGGQAEGALEDQVVERHEGDLGRLALWLGDESLVELHKGPVEEPLKSGRDVLAATLDVGGDQIGLGDHLVAEAGIELHVAGLVDLLG
jgi:hypothetical protein